MYCIIVSERIKWTSKIQSIVLVQEGNLTSGGILIKKGNHHSLKSVKKIADNVLLLVSAFTLLCSCETEEVLIKRKKLNLIKAITQ